MSATLILALTLILQLFAFVSIACLCYRAGRSRGDRDLAAARERIKQLEGMIEYRARVD